MFEAKYNNMNETWLNITSLFKQTLPVLHLKASLY